MADVYGCADSPGREAARASLRRLESETPGLLAEVAKRVPSDCPPSVALIVAWRVLDERAGRSLPGLPVSVLIRRARRTPGPGVHPPAAG